VRACWRPGSGRFEVRFHVHGRSTRCTTNPDLAIPQDALFAAVERELAVARPVWDRAGCSISDESDLDAFSTSTCGSAHRSSTRVFAVRGGASS
jgi:hypothetical protein